MLTDEDKKWIQDEFTKVYERVERAETTMLTMFDRFAQSNELRLRGMEAQMRSFQDRLNDSTDRISRLERQK